MMKRVMADGVRLFLVDDVPPEDMGMLMALYARNPASVEVHLNEVYQSRAEALAAAIAPFVGNGPGCDGATMAAMAVWSGNHPTVRAKKLNQKWVAGYGHASIKDCGNTAFFVEGGSMLLAKALQDTPLYNGQEMSSRAVDCGEQPYVDPINTAASRAVLEGWRGFYKRMLPLADAETRRRHPMGVDEDPGQYDRAVRMRALDVCRGFVPFGCATQVGWSTTLRHAGDRLGVLQFHPSAEVRRVALELLSMAQERYPDAGFGEAVASGVGALNDREEARAARRAWTRRAAEGYTYVPETQGRHPGMDHASDVHLRKKARDLLADRPRGALVPHSMAALGQDRFDLLLDCGCWRDIQRQRAMVVEPALLTAYYGFEEWYLDQLPDLVRAEAFGFVRLQADLVEALTDDPVIRQYYLGLGFRMRTRISSGLPGLIYALELRSGKEIHPVLRREVLKMVEWFRSEHEGVALHVNADPDDWSVRRGAHVITERALPRGVGGAE